MSKKFSKIFEKAFDSNEALKILNIDREKIIEMREKLKDSKNVPQGFPDLQYLVFLNMYPDDVDRAAKRMETYFKCKRNLPEFFRERNVNGKKVQQCMENQYYLILPRINDTLSLAYHGLRSHTPADYNLDQTIKTMIMTSETLVFSDGPAAFKQVYLFDMHGTSFGHIFRTSINVIRKGLTFLETANPCRIEAIHVLNSSSFMNLVLALVRPFIHSRILERTHFYTPDMDWEKFYTECIPKRCLPSNYGGLLDSVEVLHKRTCEKIMELDDYFDGEEKLVFGEN